MLEMMCRQNCKEQTSKEIEKLGKSLAILPMLHFLKPFFQSCSRDIRLHKRLELFSGYIRDILSEPQDFADEAFIRNFCNLIESLIPFAKSNPSKLVRFEVSADLTKSYFSFKREKLQHDKDEDTFSQVIHIKKESEDQLLLHVVACVHIDGQIDKMGAFQSVIMLAGSGVERFENCMTRFGSAARVKLEEEDSDRFRVVLCSSQREKLDEILQVLGEELSESLVDLEMSEVTPCPLTMRSVPSKERIVSLRLKYKWDSNVVDLESKDFEAFVDSSAKGTRQPEMRITGLTIPPAQLTEESCRAVLPASVAGNVTLQSLTQLQKRLRIHCDKFELNFYQTMMQGHNCVVGDKTTLNNQMSNQRALPEGANRSITDGKRSGESTSNKDRL